MDRAHLDEQGRLLLPQQVQDDLQAGLAAGTLIAIRINSEINGGLITVSVSKGSNVLKMRTSTALSRATRCKTLTELILQRSKDARSETTGPEASARLSIENELPVFDANVPGDIVASIAALRDQ